METVADTAWTSRLTWEAIFSGIAQPDTLLSEWLLGRSNSGGNRFETPPGKEKIAAAYLETP
jgi:hypothetical protein